MTTIIHDFAARFSGRWTLAVALVVAAAAPVAVGASLVACADSEQEAPLQLARVSPSEGTARGGTAVTIEGSGLEGTVAVWFGDTPATVLAAASTAVQVVTPAVAAGPVDVHVQVGDQRVSVAAGFTFLRIPLSFFDVAPAYGDPAVYAGRAATAADVDGDGDLDVVQAAGSEGAMVHVNDGAGLFTFSQSVGASDAGEPDDVSAVVAGDFDGDGAVDLFLATSDQAASRLLLGDGGGQFVEAADPQLPADLDPVRAVVGTDVDGDGNVDLVAISASGLHSAHNMLLLNDGAGVFTDVAADRLPDVDFAASGLAAGDVDGDGDIDLLLSGDEEPCRLYLGDGAGAFVRASPEALPAACPAGAGSAALGDLDGDGAVDVYLPAPGQDRVYFNDGAGRLFDVTSAKLGSQAGGGTVAAMADLDLDGHRDVVVIRSGGPVRVYRNDGTGRLFDYSGDVAPNLAGWPSVGLTVGDWDGDGDRDLFVSRAGWAPPALLVSWDPAPLDDADGDGLPDELDNCRDVANPDQLNGDSHHFRCPSVSACDAQTGCELAVRGSVAYLVCRDAEVAWAGADSFCRGRDAKLVTLDDVAQDGALAGLGVTGLWLGYTDAATEGTWLTAAGDALGYDGWGAGEPQDVDGTEDCAAIDAAGDWVAVSCDGPRGFVCRDVRAKTPDPGDACDRCPERNEPGDAPVAPDAGAVCDDPADGGVGDAAVEGGV